MTYDMWKRSIEYHATRVDRYKWVSRLTVAAQLADAIIYLSQPDLFETAEVTKQRMRALEQARANYRAICQK